MKVYSPSDIAELLHVKTATLRKYSILLEKSGYEFKKNARKQRYYSDDDVIMLRKLITFKNNGMTLDESVKSVMLWHKGNESEVTSITLSKSEMDNVTEHNKSDIDELKELVHKQNDMIGELSKRLDQQQEYIDKRMNERDQLLLQRLDQSMEEQKKLINSEKEKKGLFDRLFNK